MRTYLFILFSFFLNHGAAQNFIFTPANEIPISDSKGILQNGWAGGLNASTFTAFDFDLDGIEDLLVLDRQQNRPLVFLAKQNKYVYSPEMAGFLPPLNRYAIFYDYNNDGKKDLFTSTNLGIRLFKNVSTSTHLQFQLKYDPIPTRYFSNQPINMSITNSEIPYIGDIDKDGDVDILHFYSQTGENVLLETNFSMEKYGRPDSLHFGSTNECWGGFTENSCTNYMFGGNCKLSYNYRLEHIGDGALTVFDMDGNGFPDLLVGKSDCQNLNLLQNNGSGTVIFYTKLTSSYPPNSPSNSLFFPVSNIIDLDFDGIKDLVVTTGSVVPDPQTNQKSTIWFYKNMGSNNVPNFVLQSKNFLQSTMIDHGQKTAPSFADADGDGDLDMFVSNSTNLSTQAATLFYYQNVGTSTSPAYLLSDTNYLEFAQYQYDAFSVTFTDLNNDTKTDLVYTSQKGSSYSVKVRYNQSSSGLLLDAPSALNIPVDGPLSLSFHPIDPDELKDVLVGDVDGQLHLYLNVGTAANPSFVLSSSNYGGLSSAYFNCNPSICDLNNDGEQDLIVANDSGYAKVCYDFLHQNTLRFTYESLPLFPRHALGQNIRIAPVDLNADGYPEIAVGSATGGISLLKYSPLLSDIKSTLLENDSHGLLIWPNPTDDIFKIALPETGTLKIYDGTGRLLYQSDEKAIQTVQMPSLKTGLYVVLFQGKSTQKYTQKIIVQ